MPPQCRMLSPIFHPNIAPHAICVGDHWSAGEPLWSIVARIGEMIAYQSYNTKSPLNGEAARWVDENGHRLPLDPVSLLVEEPEESERLPRRPAAPPHAARPGGPPPLPRAAAETTPPAPASAVAEPPEESIQIECPSCGTRYRIPATTSARRARCKNCQSLIPIP
jgi:hypothetical protein